VINAAWLRVRLRPNLPESVELPLPYQTFTVHTPDRRFIIVSSEHCEASLTQMKHRNEVLEPREIQKKKKRKKEKN
jgi:hypothetical protein